MTGTAVLQPVLNGYLYVFVCFLCTVTIQTAVVGTVLGLDQADQTWVSLQCGSRFLAADLVCYLSFTCFEIVFFFFFFRLWDHSQCCPPTCPFSTRCFQHWMIAARQLFSFAYKPFHFLSLLFYWSTSAAWPTIAKRVLQSLPSKGRPQRFKEKHKPFWKSKKSVSARHWLTVLPSYLSFLWPLFGSNPNKWALRPYQPSTFVSSRSRWLGWALWDSSKLMWCKASTKSRSWPFLTTWCCWSTKFWFAGWRSRIETPFCSFAVSWLASFFVIIARPRQCRSLGSCWRHRHLRMWATRATHKMPWTRFGMFSCGRYLDRQFWSDRCGFPGSLWSTLSPSSQYFVCSLYDLFILRCFYSLNLSS